jgi:hypothetical protein
VNNVRASKRHVAEPLISEPSCFEFENVVEKLERYKPPCINLILAELFVSFRVACDSVRRKILCSILIEFNIPKKLVRQNEMLYHLV